MMFNSALKVEWSWSHTKIISRSGGCSVCFLLAWGTQSYRVWVWLTLLLKMPLNRWCIGCLLFHLVEGVHGYMKRLCWCRFSWNSPSIRMYQMPSPLLCTALSHTAFPLLPTLISVLAGLLDALTIKIWLPHVIIWYSRVIVSVLKWAGWYPPRPRFAPEQSFP